MTDTGLVGLVDADDALDGGGAEADADAGAGGDGGGNRGGDVGVGAGIEVEQGALCALEEDLVTSPVGLLDDGGGVRDVGAEAVAELGVLGEDFVEVERRR